MEDEALWIPSDRMSMTVKGREKLYKGASMRTVLWVVARKVSVIVCGVLIVRWVFFAGATLFFRVAWGSEWVVRFYREMSDTPAGAEWNAANFVRQQLIYLLITIVSGLFAVYCRRQVKSHQESAL